MEYGYIYFLLILGLLFIGISFLKRLNAVKKMRQEALNKYDETKEEFKTLTSTQFDEIKVDELTHAVIFRIMEKDESRDPNVPLVSLLSHPEKLIYTIYLVELSMGGGRGSIHSFFLDEQYQDFVSFSQEAFEAVQMFTVSKLMEGASNLAKVIEEEKEDDIEGEYSNYNFADFTAQIMGELKSSAIVTIAGQYIKDHKDQFIDKE